MFLRGVWLPLGAVLAVAGLIAGSGPFFGTGLFVLLAGGAALLWPQRALEDLTFERLLPERRAFPGESLTLTYRIANAKRLPVPRLTVTDQLPERLAPEEMDLPPATAGGMVTYSRVTHAGSRERLRWPIELSCRERGHYRLGPARLDAGDPFGFATRSRSEQRLADVVVYPRTFALTDLGLPAERPLGERRGGPAIFEDPLRAAGVRDYQPGDALRRIDWKATARRGALQSRVYEPSATPHLLLAANVDTLPHSWQGFIPELLEAVLSTAGSIARWAFDERYAVGLVANGSLPESDRPIRIAPGRGPQQLVRILEALGGVGPLTMTTLADALAEEAHRLPFGSTVVLVAAAMPEPLAAVARRLHDEGHRVVALSVGEHAWMDTMGPIPVRTVALEAVSP